MAKLQLIMCKGLPASGKTTWAKKQVGFKRVNKDDLRAMLDNSVHTKGNEKFVLLLRDMIIQKSLSEGISIIIDDTNLAPYHETRLRELAAQYKAEFIEMLFDTPADECVKRDARRANPVGPQVILGMANQYNVVKKHRINTDLPYAVICDIDGTIAKMNGRSPYEWNRVIEDKPIYEVIDAVKSIVRNSDKKLIFLSGRDGSCETETRQWLESYFSDTTYVLYMRAKDDNRKDVVIKQELFDKHIRGKYNVACVFDDRDQVVKLWRDMGLQCFQCNYGNF